MQRHAQAQTWMERLGLEPHPEGGHYRQSYQAALVLPQSALPAHRGDRPASTAIYFLLQGEEFSAFHRIRSDELWHFYAGSSLVVHVLTPQGEHRQIRLGSAIERGEQLQDVVEAGCWFGATLARPAPEAFALVGCTVAPGFHFADFEMARRDVLEAEYPQHRELVRSLTRI
jgi:predicted cupin superfamily sugar epimerase